MTENKRFTVTQDFEEHHRQIRDNGHIIMGCFVEPQAEVIVNLLNELSEENEQLKEAVWSWSNSYNKVYQENQQLKNLIQHTYQIERTELGRNVLKQLLDQME